jgi:hypothetical protein
LGSGNFFQRKDGAQKPRPFILRRRREPKKIFLKKIRPTGRPAALQICELVDLGLSRGLKFVVAITPYYLYRKLCPRSQPRECYVRHVVHVCENYRDRKRLEERPSIPELLAIWQRAHNVCAPLAERQTDPVKRAAWHAQLAEREAEMKQLRERLAQVLPEALNAEPDEPELSEEGKLAMQRFRGFGQAVRLERRRAGRAR